MKIDRAHIRRMVRREMGIISEACGCAAKQEDDPVTYDEPGGSMLSMLRHDDEHDHDGMNYYDNMGHSMDPHAGNLRAHDIDDKTLGRYGNIMKRSMQSVPCPGSYQKASAYLMQDPTMALDHSHDEIAQATGTHCPVSVCRAIADIVDGLEGYIS